MESNIEQLERRYQTLLNDYQSGRLDEAAFVAEVDQLQFQDEWGRYWMIGTQSGDWHYYDGQTWHQADPRDADKLPIMDEQGRYWQKGTKSGEWYYFDAAANEWVKPSQNEPAGPAAAPAASYTPPQSYTPQPQQTYGQAYDSGPVQASAAPDAGQFGTELFQDDEGRYWAVGAKSGQWYFYDDNGWHPADEFQGGAGQSQPYQPYPTQHPQQPAQQYPSQTSQFAAQGYAPQPQQPYTPAAGQAQQQAGQMYAAPTGPAQSPTDTGQMPSPPPGAGGQSGSWFYFDGEQWLQYSSGEPAADTPPDPGLILEQDSEPAKKEETEKAEPKEETTPIVAEFIEEDEPPAEVVDVEVITVFEPEPEPSDTPAPQAQSEPVTSVSPEPEPFTPTPTSASSLSDDQVVPRRTRISPTEDVKRDKAPGAAAAGAVAGAAAASQATPRTPTDPNRPVTPRRRSSAPHEPTIIIPTGSTTTPASSARASRASSPTAPIPQAKRRRARENTLPMEPVSKTDPSKPVPSTTHRQVTQAMPAITTAGAATAAGAAPASASQQTAKQPTGTQPAASPAPNKKDQTEKSGYTLGEILRAFPSTMWTFAGGIIVLIIFAVIFIGAMSLFSGSDDAGGVAVVLSPTPTLNAGPPDSTPTPGPTPTGEAGPVFTPTPVSEATFSSSDLDITLEYPENWQTADNAQVAIFSPSAGKLDPDTIKETGMRIGKSAEEDASISDLLAETLSLFPLDAETLNEGTISIASQTWTSTQIRFEDENLDGEGIATLAVTNKDGDGYYLIAVSSADEWNSVQPTFQGMINSFRFGAETVVAEAATPESTQKSSTKTTSGADEEADEDEESSSASEDEESDETTPTPAPTKKPTPTPLANATPLVYAIKSGDTLLGIAAKFGVDADLLASENGIDDPDGLQIGQELTIPFTAEELAAYNGTGGGSVASASDEDDETAEDDEQASSETDATSADEEAAAADAPAEADEATEEEATEAAPVSGRIVYPAFNPGPGVYDVWMVDLATGEQTPIAGTASQPAFNKDGTLLAYRSWDRGTRGIFFRDFVGGRGGIVTKFVEDALPTWSPDGYSFAFSSRKEGDRVPRIYIGNQQGENPFSVGFQGEYASTFPDGKLVVKGCTPSGDCGLFTMGPRGGGEKKISGESSDTAPAVSPDGTKIAIMSRDRGGNNWEIWLMNADGTNPQRLTENNNNDGLPTWSPDGQSIAFVSDRGGTWGVWVMNTDGSNQRKLFDMKGSPDGKVLYDEFNSRGWLEERISWAP